MKKRLPIIIIAVLVVVFAGLGFYSHQKSKIKYNTSYVNGNTAGNLYNAGFGYRWEFKKGINVRIDYGLTPDGGGFIFNINEAF